ncbi:MAG TPA: hypothetical protein ENK05_13055 [Gammaproteobacteria bacterium]|nr:hypothetical protein [Gammaproteobacteria bacterium]
MKHHDHSTALRPALLAAALLLAAAGGPARGEEQLQSEGMAVIGNRELPKALVIVPWKDPEASVAPDRPVNSLIDEALQPVDPDVFRRKLQYYDSVHTTD